MILGTERLKVTDDLIALLTLPEWRASLPQELKRAKEEKRAEAERVKIAYMANLKAEIRKRKPKSKISDAELTQTIMAAVEQRVLMPEFELHYGKQIVTVAQLFADPGRWDLEHFADPLEPEYNDGDVRISTVYLSGIRPHLWSWAHGGQRFELIRERKIITAANGEMPRMVDECLAMMREAGEFYEYNGVDLTQLKRTGGQSMVRSPEALDDYLGRRIRFQKWMKTANGVVPVDVPDKLSKTIIKKSGERGLPVLKGVITAPILRADGSLLNEPGYDAASGLLLIGDDFPRIAEKLDDGGLHAALATLMKPYEKFPYATNAARGVMLAAALTAIVRRTLPTAPGFASDAPMASSGKTLLMLSMLRFAGVTPSVWPSAAGDEREIRKGLLTRSRSGVAAWLMDNVVGVLSSPSLDAYMTAEYYSDRVLCTNEGEEYPANRLVLFSGNNMVLGGTLWRRILTIRLDAKTDRPDRRHFKLRPIEYCRVHRQEMVAAGLGILRTFLTEGKTIQTKDEKGENDPMGSFEDWDGLIRQCVVWLGNKGIAQNTADPCRVTEEAKEKDPDTHTLALFHAGIAKTKGAAKWKVADLEPLYRNPKNEELREAIGQIEGAVAAWLYEP